MLQACARCIIVIFVALPEGGGGVHSKGTCKCAALEGKFSLHYGLDKHVLFVNCGLERV